MPKKLDLYEVGDDVQVHMGIGNSFEWRKGVVVSKQTVYPVGGFRHRPYTMLIVEAVRTYFNSATQEFYDKLNQEGYVYANQVKDI